MCNQSKFFYDKYFVSNDMIAKDENDVRAICKSRFSVPSVVDEWNILWYNT